MKTTICVLVCGCWISTAVAGTAGSPLASVSLDRYDEFVQLLEDDWSNLIENHGEELLGHLMFKRPPSDEELARSVSDPGSLLMDERKDEFPVLKALRKGREKTVAMLNSTDFFDYPVTTDRLETIAYLLLDLMGSEKGREFVEGKLASASAYEKENWDRMRKIMGHPALGKGRFVFSRGPLPPDYIDPRPDHLRVREQRRRLKELRSTEGESVIEDYYRFERILDGIRRLFDESGRFPDSLYELVALNYMEAVDLLFKDPAGFLYSPRYKLPQGKEERPELLRLRSPNGVLCYKGYSNGEVVVVASRAAVSEGEN